MIRNPTPKNDGPRSPVRRKLLHTAALLLASATTIARGVFSAELAVPGLEGGVEGNGYFEQNLTQLARLLFPHDGLGSAPYEAIAQALIRQASKDEQLAKTLKAGVAQLDKGSLTPWRVRNEVQQLAVISRLEGSDFFRLVRITTIEHLYRNPEVWQLLGYQGSSVEFGGYVDRGFDDIGWLPVGGKLP